MPLSREIESILKRSGLEVKPPPIPYLDKIPTLDRSIFLDEVTILDISQSGSKDGKKLHELLKQADLTGSQRGGITHLLGSFCLIEDYKLTIGDIRSLTEEELIKLRPLFAFGLPSHESISKIKKLFG